MTLKELKDSKREIILNTMDGAIMEECDGSDIIIINNISPDPNSAQFGCVTISKLFTQKELKFIEKENVLAAYEEQGWDVTIVRTDINKYENVQFIFKAIQPKEK